ncbi:hypothetical protein LXA43DRAFT_905780, partial [Ganoderma leucocontextum]
QHLVPVARRALLYQTGDTRPRLVLLPTEDEWEPACGAPPYAEDFDASGWFDGDHEIVPIYEFPGTGCFLDNGFDIFISAPPKSRNTAARPPINQTLQRLFSVSWRGSLIVMKRSSRDRRSIHITRPEISLINVVVQRSVSNSLISMLPY